MHRKSVYAAIGAAALVLSAATSAVAVNLGILDQKPTDRVGQLDVTATRLEPDAGAPPAPTSTTSTTSTTTRPADPPDPAAPAPVPTTAASDDHGRTVPRATPAEAGDDRSHTQPTDAPKADHSRRSGSSSAGTGKSSSGKGSGDGRGADD